MDDNTNTRKKYKKTPLEYEEIIHDEGYTFIWYVWDEGVYRKKYVKGRGRYREYVYSMETYERVKQGKYRHKYIRKKAVMPPMILWYSCFICTIFLLWVFCRGNFLSSFASFFQ